MGKEKRGAKKRRIHSLCGDSEFVGQRIKYTSGNLHAPSTAAMTTLSIAVSVAVVTLTRVLAPAVLRGNGLSGGWMS